MSRSTDGYTAYVEAAWPRLFRTAYALTGSVADADELLQATLVKVFLHWRRVNRADTPDAYVRRIMVNHAASGWRSSRNRHETPVAEVGTGLTGEGFDDDLVSRDELWVSVQGLPVRQRAVVVLRYYEQLSEREIATTLDIAPGTVKSLASAALTKLRGQLTPIENHTPRGNA